MGLNKIDSSNINWGKAASDINSNFDTIGSDLQKVKNATTKNKGYFSSSDKLLEAYPSAHEGDIAYVKQSGYTPFERWKWNGTAWVGTGESGGNDNVTLGDYYNRTEVDKKLEDTDEVISELRTDTDAKLSELGSEIGSVTKHFDISSGSSHSSKYDKITINGKAGDVIQVSVFSSSSDSSVIFAIYGYTSDGVSEFITDEKIGRTYDVLLENDYSEIGIYIGPTDFSHTISFSAKFGMKLKVDDLDNKLQLVSYFGNADKPIFQFTDNNEVVVTLPSANTPFRLYDRRKNRVVSIMIEAESRKFNIPIYNALIYDITENKFSVVNITDSSILTNDTYILLFNKSIGICDGLLAEYFNQFVEQRNRWSIQNAMGGYSENISIFDGRIVIRHGFSLINGIGRSFVVCREDYTINTLDDISGTRVIRTFVYLDTFALGTGAYLNGDDAKDIFIITSEPKANDSTRYLLFTTFYYQTAMGGLIDTIKVDSADVSQSLYIDKEVERNQCRFRSDFNCLFFSDIHYGINNMDRIIELANSWGDSYIDVVLNGGDTVRNTLSDGLDWYHGAIQQTNIDVLAAAGNHDEWSEVWSWADSKDIYDALIEPIVSRVDNVVQPIDAASEGKLYYYKDYGKVRVLVLEPTSYGSTIPFWDATQSTWMRDTLEDARVNDLAVICLCHVPFAKDDGEIDESITFNSWIGYTDSYVDSKQNIQFDPLAVVDEALANVDTFISNGGKFICWLAGHTHQDYFVKSISHPNQMMFVTSSALYEKGSDYQTTSKESSPLYDCMNYIGIDLDKMWLQILRIGKNIDGYMRRKNVLVYDLTNQKVITNY